jgi:hypothetical protein
MKNVYKIDMKVNNKTREKARAERAVAMEIKDNDNRYGRVLSFADYTKSKKIVEITGKDNKKMVEAYLVTVDGRNFFYFDKNNYVKVVNNQMRPSDKLYHQRMEVVVAEDELDRNFSYKRGA